MSGDATPEPTLDEAIDGAFNAEAEGDSFGSDDEPTIEDELVDILRGDDDEDFVEEPALEDDEEEASEEPVGDLYTVKVDGQEVEVTLDELLGGYQRQADYTRKTQALSAEREELAAYKRFDMALQSNPEAAIKALAETVGVQLGGTPPSSEDDPLGDLDDPLVQHVKALEAEIKSLRSGAQEQIEAQQNAARLAAVDAELEAVRVKANDPSFDEAELLQFALDNNVGNLEVAYTAMQAIKGQSAAANEQQEIVARKRRLPPVEGGRARSKGSTRRGSSNKMSFEEALEAALDN